VTIEEPHMYNADDAVAKIDSYVVEVSGGGRYVGDRKMVRIERVERAAAVASLLGDPPGSNGAGSDALESAAAR
jgi:ribonuclease G